MATNKELASKILELVGGKSNVKAATNCMTRLRLRIKDTSKVKVDELKSTEGVMGVVESDTLQVVVGPGKAKKLADIFNDELGVPKDSVVTEDWQENKASVKAGQKKGALKAGLETIAGIFIPLIPAIIAAGIFNGFASLIGTMQGQEVISGDTWEFIRLMFSLIGSGFLGYFAIYTGVNAAKRFGATEALGGMIGAMTIGSQIVNISQMFGLYDADVPLNSILTTGKGGIIGVIIGVYLLAKVEKAVRKVVPDVLDLIVTPLVTLLVVGLALVLVIMPVSGFASDILVDGLSVIINSDNTIVSIISGYVLAALFLPMVLLGLHHGLIPIYAIQLEAMGGVSLFPVLAMAGAGQVGAAIAIYLKAKKVNNKRMQSVITGALPAGILGIGEPLIYGVTLPLGKPFITAGLGAGFGGAYVMATNVMASAWGPSGLVALPLMHADKIIHFFFGIVISYIGGFIITNIFINSKDVENV
ncbi:PTS transporter subunit EIIC [Alkalicella caledoniensis]|uniref:PTS transporter subunit EIIC n=1 Tax=Alkalicella caledoniensis TaxID=2731377 RepID=A0A7G9W9E5_ALKCA|nr:PTS transporter subunit EIIC [Alkalicella caledoniensis]QNO15307.1 PTS transporter subunit EIIC [Alkalicella caledoniensis]